VFYVNVPIGIAATVIAWAASSGWETPRRAGRVDVVGAVLFSAFLVGALGALTLLGSRAEAGEGGAFDPVTAGLVLTGLALVAGPVSIVRGLRVQDPFLDPRLFRQAPFAAAALVSALTGYGFATAIVGGAVFVDRVLYGGPGSGSLAPGTATAVGALVSGSRSAPVAAGDDRRAGASIGPRADGGLDARHDQAAAGALALFGGGFGLTVTPRSTAAVESVAREAYGIASSTVTVARMVGMAVGLAILTAYGSTTIDNLYDRVYATPDAYREFIPESLRDRPLQDGLVVEALEAWAASEAARIMVGVFLVAVVVTAVAVPPSLSTAVGVCSPTAGGNPAAETPPMSQAPGRAGAIAGEPAAQPWPRTGHGRAAGPSWAHEGSASRRERRSRRRWPIPRPASGSTSRPPSTPRSPSSLISSGCIP
jgi:hypothetical protein